MNLQKVNNLVKAIERANEAAISIENKEDGGTCNFDSPVIKLDRWTAEEIKEVSKLTKVHISEKLSGWFQGYRWISTVMHGQGNCRTRMAEAAKKSLEADGFNVRMYYQMD